VRRNWAIYKKEIVDNFRDKRSLFFALLYGPILLPLLVIGPLASGIKKNTVNVDELHHIYMVSPDRAPNLVQFLLEKNIAVKPTAERYKSKILSQELNLVLELSPKYDEALRNGQSAVVYLYYSRKNNDAQKIRHLVDATLRQYNQSLAASRLSLRGLDSDFVHPVHVVSEDLADVDSGMKLISTIVPFVIVLALTMGGFYLAVDSTAGERERHSLEPLLSLSVSRLALVLGKYFSLVTFVSASGLLTVFSLFLLFKFMPGSELQALFDTELAVFIGIFLLCLPLAPFFSSSMMLIATFARDVKEAQTHLGIAMMVPMAPFFILQFANLNNMDGLFFIPVLSQFMLIEKIVAGEDLGLLLVVRSVVATLALAAILLLLTIRLYKRESMLGK